MLFPEEDAPILKAWIVKRIEDTSDADAEVLAEYIIALLKHDGDKASVRELCEQEIPDFLTEDPKAFLDDVFQAIAYKSYVPGAPAAPKLQPPSSEPKPTADNGPPPATNSKKRGLSDRDDVDMSAGPDGHQNGPRATKQQRRRGRGRGADDVGKRGDFPLVPGMPPFDPQNPAAMEAFMAMSMQYPGMAQFLGQGQNSRSGQPRRRGRCRDFDTKGYCSRGTSCQFDHGNESLYVPPSAQQGDDYNPDQSMLSQNLLPFMNPFAFAPENNRGRGGRKGGRGAGRKGGSRAPFSADGPVHDRTKSTIVVENIPEENFNEDQVRGFFSQFGDIVEVSMQPYKHLAIVKYDDWGAANAAYRSPKVIFDNRFVKVFWYKDDADTGVSSSTSGKKSNGQVQQDQEKEEPEIDPEEFQRKQEEAQKQFQERESKRTELERQRSELEKKQLELMKKHREESERLQVKLLGKKGGDSSDAAPSSGPDMLRAKLAALEQEAKILGLDPDAAPEEDGASNYPPRGGFQGRGGFRGRPSRGWRGGGGGRGSFHGADGRHAAYAQYSLDNRPKKLAITGVDFTAADKDESLRHYLLNLGEFESVDTSPSTTYVSFRDRKTAEKLYNSLNGKELPGIEGKLELAWANNVAMPPSNAPPAAAPPKDKDRDDVMGSVDDGEAANGMQQRQQHPQPQPQQQHHHEEASYGGAGDDDDAY